MENAHGVADLAQWLDRQGGIGGRGRRSPLTQWMWQHRVAFAALLEQGQPSWATIAEYFTAMGMRDGSGKALTAKRARTVWWSVQRLGAKAAEPPAPALGAGEIAVGVRAVSPAQAMTGGSRKPALDSKPVVPRNPDPGGEAAGSPPSADGAEASTTTVAASASMRRLYDQMSARSVSMPKKGGQ